MSELDWRWLRSFVAVADAGGMHAAARSTGLSQPTLSRHIRQLEEHTGLRLFERRGRVLVLSAQGEALIVRARTVRDAVVGFSQAATGVSEDLTGPVRVSMTWHLALYFAPDWLVSLRGDHPGISVDLMPDDEAANLLQGEADVAVRHFRPTQLDLVQRRCGALRLGFFASTEYVDAHGAPLDLDALRTHRVIGFDRVTAWIETARQLGHTYRREDFVARSDASVVQAALARRGLGIAVLPRLLGRHLSLVRVLPELEVGQYPVLLTAQPDVLKSPRVARVWRHLGDGLARWLQRGGEGELPQAHGTPADR